MDERRRSDTARLFGYALAASGITTTVAARRLSRGLAAPVDRRIVRAFGLRQLGQGVVVASIPDPTIVALGVGADLAHVLSVVPVVAGSRRFRRPALVSAAVALTWAGAGSALARWLRADPR